VQGHAARFRVFVIAFRNQYIDNKMTAPPPEPRNPFYLLLLLASFLFVVTALAYAVVPTLEEKAREAGEIPPPSAFRDALRESGWMWLLAQVACMVVLGVLSMGLDRLRSLKKERQEATISKAEKTITPS
jgi:hypothetical protein